MSRYARDLSYAYGMKTPLGRGVVRGVENLTGRLTIIRRARGYDRDIAKGSNFYAALFGRMGLTFAAGGAGLEGIPREGPLVMVANHPFGVLDGFSLARLLHDHRAPIDGGPGFRVLAHEVFARAPDIRDTILPIDFSETPEAARRNIETRKEALSFLARGGAVGIFPGGTVSTPLTPFGVAMDPEWRRFTAKMVARSGASVLPVFFEGSNSRAFHLASHISTGLRLGLFLHEFRKQLDRPVRVHIGKVIPPEALAPFVAQPKSMMDFLREQTYGLSPQPLDWQILGKDFG